MQDVVERDVTERRIGLFRQARERDISVEKLGRSVMHRHDMILAVLFVQEQRRARRARAPVVAHGQDSELQNALARLGALHLQESSDVLPSERLSEASDVIREAIVGSESPRLVTALAPVLVGNIDHLNLTKVHLQLTEAGLGRRLAWLVENTLEAIRRELPGVSPAPWRRLYSRAQVVLGSFLDFVNVQSDEEIPAPDVLDPSIRSKQTLAEVTASASPISRRWGIVTTLQPEDFVEALRSARAARR
jgi:hypothetical protein